MNKLRDLSLLIGLLLLIQFSATTGCSKRPNTGTTDNSGKDTAGIKTDVSAWITSPQKNILFRHQAEPLLFGTTVDQNPAIEVDTTMTYQSIDGFGNCLTGGSATLIRNMDKDSRQRLLNELFATDGNNIGISYLRISIGASDLSDHVFSYDDMPPGNTDTEMTHFSIDPEKADLIPVLREILAINPEIKILGSPWSAPVWMKTNQNSVGGSLKNEYFAAYARYFVKYIQAMSNEGINLDAITIQNEPLHDGNNPSMYMTAEDQSRFIKTNLGPAFSEAGIRTRIIVYDHNADRPDYPLTIYNDQDAAKYVDGAAFHLYAGTIEALSGVHDSFPEKNLYFTEQWVGAPGNLKEDLVWHTENLIIGATRKWCRTVLEWNMASDPSYNPHTDGGCSECLGTVTLNGNSVTRNSAYYILAHASKFIRPGSVRIRTNTIDYLPNVAFRTPDGNKVLIVLNTDSSGKTFNLKFNGKSVSLSLDSGAVGTYVW